VTTDNRPRRPPAWFRLPFLALWCLLAAAGVARLVSGEQAAGARRAALAEVGRRVVDIDPAAPPAGSSGPVHVTGEARAAAPLVDPRFGVRVRALRLDREVEMFQWEELLKGEARGTEERYRRVWSDRLIRSQSFGNPIGHRNPAAFAIPPRSVTATDAHLGKLALDAAIIAALPASSGLPASAAGGAGLTEEGGWLYAGDPASPRIGDLRLRLSYVPEGQISAVGNLEDGRLVPYRSADGVAVALAAPGNVSAASLIGTATPDFLESWKRRLPSILMILLGALGGGAFFLLTRRREERA
jgi:hypothetical protein